MGADRHAAVAGRFDSTEVFPAAMRILIAEDTAVDSLLLRNIVRRAGHEVLVAGSGEEALETLAEHPEIGMAIVDIGLPGMNGIELVRTIRERPTTAHLPVLFASGISEAETVRAAAALHPQGYILKPFTEPRKILDRIEKVLADAPRVVDDEDTIGARTGLGAAGVRALLEQLGEALEAWLEGGGGTEESKAGVEGLARQAGAERLLAALRTACDGTSPEDCFAFEARAVLNTIRKQAA